MTKKLDIIVQTWRRASFVALILTLFAVNAVAQKAQPAPVASTQTAPTMLWKVSDKNGKTAYLFGSIHLGKKEFYPFSPEVENAFNNSSKLLVEADISKIDQATMQKLVVENGLYTGEDSLAKNITPASLEKLKKFSADYGLPYEALLKMKPWLVAINIGIAPFQKSGFLAEYGVDKHFLDRARDKKQIVEIESADWQIKMLAGMPNDQQIKYLEFSLGEAGNFNTFAQKLVSAWQSADPKQLEEMFKATTPVAVEFNKLLLDNRNPRMADFTEQCVKNDEKCFVTVGAGHIVGAKGIAQILKDRGYKVEQVFAATAKK